LKNTFKYIALVFFLCTFQFCKTDSTIDIKSISEQINTLKSIEDKRAYLENIFFDYQLILNEEEKIIRQYDSDSPEYLEYYKKKSNKDQFYISSIEIFFEAYGYPRRSELGQYATIAPIIVHFYATDNKGFERHQFKYFYGAYKFNDIPENYFLAYMQGFYEANEGRAFMKNKSMTAAEEIYAIMDAMGYDY